MFKYKSLFTIAMYLGLYFFNAYLIPILTPAENPKFDLFFTSFKFLGIFICESKSSIGFSNELLSTNTIFCSTDAN